MYIILRNPLRQPKTIQTMPPTPQTTSFHDAASQILQLVIRTITITTTPPLSSHQNTQATDPNTLATTSTSTSVPTTHIATYLSPPAALPGMATSIASSMIPSTTSTSLATPLLEPSPDFLPAWPLILAIFLFSWLVMAWIVAVVLFLASFPEKVAWLDWWIERLRGGGGRRDRYVKKMMTTVLEAYGGFDVLITLQAYFTAIRRLCIQRLGVFHSRVYKSK
jgi:hypothetical protein